MPHAIWGFSGTSAGAVYLAAAWYAQISPPSASTASTCRTLTTPFEDVHPPPRLPTAGLAVAQMKGEAYLGPWAPSQGWLLVLS